MLDPNAPTVLSGADAVTRLLEKVRDNFGFDSVAVLRRDGAGWERIACTRPRSVFRSRRDRRR